ncbi:MAG: hypothetical protein ACXABY_32920 [Candidatus Thorarchaeota archaeon]|jgi:hypothetical protein
MVQFILPQTQKRLIKVGNKVVGSLEGNRFIKSVNGSKHKLRQPPAWAIDAEAFDSEVRLNATEIVVIDKETDTKYHASVEIFARHSFRLNRGFGDQYALPLQFWQTSVNGNRQLSLWGGKSID